jgi:hypothetical protein
MRINRLAFVTMAVAILMIYTLLPDMAAAQSSPGARTEATMTTHVVAQAASTTSITPAAEIAAFLNHEQALSAPEAESPPGTRLVALVNAESGHASPYSRAATNEHAPPGDTAITTA